MLVISMIQVISTRKAMKLNPVQHRTLPRMVNTRDTVEKKRSSRGSLCLCRTQVSREKRETSVNRMGMEMSTMMLGAMNMRRSMKNPPRSR